MYLCDLILSITASSISSGIGKFPNTVGSPERKVLLNDSIHISVIYGNEWGKSMLINFLLVPPTKKILTFNQVDLSYLIGNRTTSKKFILKAITSLDK